MSSTKEKGDPKDERAPLKYLARYLTEGNPTLVDVAQTAALLAERGLSKQVPTTPMSPSPGHRLCCFARAPMRGSARHLDGVCQAVTPHVIELRGDVMRVRLLTFPVAALCLLLGVSGCGGDDSDPSEVSAAAVEQIDAICDEWRETLDAREAFPVEDFDTENRAAEDLPRVGGYLASGQSAAEEALESIRTLPPSAEVQPEIDALVAALERELASLKAQTSFAQAGDVEQFVASLDEAVASQGAVEAASEELGGTSCAF